MSSICVGLTPGGGGCGAALATPEADALSAACGNSLGFQGCNELGRPGANGPRAAVFTGTWYAAIAKSTSTVDWGASWRETSLAVAVRDALHSCKKAGGRGCQIVVSGANNCMSLAISRGDGIWASADSNYDRSTAIGKAMNACRHAGGRQCAIVVTPCGRQDKNSQACIRQYPIDISRGEAWKEMSAEQKALWNKRGNGNCK